MPVTRVSPKEAFSLVTERGYKYVDVRSVPEFDAGHPAGAFNIPLMHLLPGRGMTPNPDFAEVMGRHFQQGEGIVIGCKTGGRSLRAAELLLGMGFTQVVDMRGGFEGERDAMGRLVEAGWRECSLPVEAETPGKSYEELKKK
ncbi:MAG: rhodanese-like domain-containing protein [Deltaproteobacteria bacterium]|nr:rhodanese-like domain-containing protein [Deltaproteobacteria bacterium]